jgi:hypothetical protein
MLTTVDYTELCTQAQTENMKKTEKERLDPTLGESREE